LLLELGKLVRLLKVYINHIMLMLFTYLMQRDLSLLEVRLQLYYHTSELEMLHRAAAWSKDVNRVADGIWPPPARYM
jgi:hypothetical protein